MDHHQLLHCLADEVNGQAGAGVVVQDGQIVLWSGEVRASLPCPTCGTHPMTPAGTLGALVGGASGRRDAEFGADVPAVQAMLFACPWSQGDCDPIIVVGEGHLDDDPFPDPDEGPGQMAVAFRPRFIQPALSLLGRVGRHVDTRIIDLGRSAGSVVWIDPDAAANKLRGACELFLEIVDVPTTTTNGDFFSLAKRIDYAASHELIEPEVKELLDGLRWLGNAGSHGPAAVQLADAIEGGHVLSLAVRLQFPDPNDDTARAKAAAWIEAKGV